MKTPFSDIIKKKVFIINYVCSHLSNKIQIQIQEMSNFPRPDKRQHYPPLCQTVVSVVRLYPSPWGSRGGRGHLFSKVVPTQLHFRGAPA